MRLAFFLLLASSLWAQTTTTITGTIKDLSQAVVTSGKVTFTLQPSRDTTISGLARFVPTQIVCLINASGLIKAQDGVSTCTLTMNAALNPPGTYYRVDVWPYNVKTSSFTFYAVLSTYDWSTVVPTPATSPAQNYVDIFSNQTIGGNKVFSGSTVIGQLDGICVIDGNTYAHSVAGINSAAASGSCGRVIAPAGSYSGTALTIPAGVVLEGDGPAGTTIAITGSGSPGIAMANSGLRNVKIDASAFTGANLLSTSADSGFLDNVLFVGNGDDTQTTNAVRIANNNWRFNKVNFDTVSEVVLTGDNFLVSGTVCTHFRTCLWLHNVTNSEVDGTSCNSVGGTGTLVINGFDCVLGDGLQTVTISNTVVKVGREHGIYLSSNGVSPNRAVKVLGVNAENLNGVGVKIHASSTSAALEERDILVSAVVVDKPVSATSNCIQADEAIGVRLTNIVCRGNGTATGGHGIDLQGLLDHVTLSGVFAELNTGDGIHVQDTNGAITHLKISDAQLLNNSQSGVGAFSGLEIQLNAASGFASTDFDFSNIESDDNQGTHTQNYGLQLDNLLNGATLTRFVVSDMRGQGNITNVITSPVPAGISNYSLQNTDGHDYTQLSGLSFPEGAGANTFSGQDICYGFSATHNVKCNFNNSNGGAFWALTQTIGSGTVTTAGTAILAGASQAQTGITITGATTTDTAYCSVNAAHVATWQTGIQLLPPVVTSNTVTVWLSNPTAGSITPAAVTVRCTVTR